jgi:hypothetical protein
VLTTRRFFYCGSIGIVYRVEREGQNTTVGGKVFIVQMTCFGPSSGPSSGLKNT